MFTPLDDASTTQLDVKGQTILGGMYGGGVAYELSPSWDIRAEYRGLPAQRAKREVIVQAPQVFIRDHLCVSGLPGSYVR